MKERNQLPTTAPGGHDCQLQTSRRFFRINRRDISFLKFILEAYDGVAVLTTEDADRGIVGIAMAPGCQPLVEAVIASLVEAGEIVIEPVMDAESLCCCQEKACTGST